MINLESEQQEEILSRVLDMVRAPDGDFATLALLGKATADPDSLELVVQDLLQNPQSKKALEERLIIGPIDFDYLGQLPAETLGYQYCQHMVANNLKPLEGPSLRTNYEYLNFHLSETHDIWHVVTHSNTDVLGELQLEAFCVAQLKYSRFWLALLIKNLLKSTVYSIELATTYMEHAMRGWQMGCTAKSLFGVPWNMFWETPIVEVRNSLNIIIETP